jgi:hypothetical protein
MSDKRMYEIVLIIDSNGDAAVGLDYNEATTVYDENVGGGAARRVIYLNVNVSPPKEEVLTVDVADDAGALEAAVAETEAAEAAE